MRRLKLAEAPAPTAPGAFTPVPPARRVAKADSSSIELFDGLTAGPPKRTTSIMKPITLWAVVHHLEGSLSLAQAKLALEAGMDGVFLISHDKIDHELPTLATTVKTMRRLDGTALASGINLQSISDPTAAFEVAAAHGLDAVWIDEPGIVAGEARGPALHLARARDLHDGPTKPRVFASVAFKYQPEDPYPAKSARAARALGFTPTTSGLKTGEPPTLDKIRLMGGSGGRELAVASGMAPANVAGFRHLVTDVLVATGVSLDEHHFDPDKLRDFVGAARSASRT